MTANEPVLGPGSGNTDPDWIITDPGPKVSPAMLGVELRAERAGGGIGRVYTIDSHVRRRVGQHHRRRHDGDRPARPGSLSLEPSASGFRERRGWRATA